MTQEEFAARVNYWMSFDEQFSHEEAQKKKALGTITPEELERLRQWEIADAKYGEEFAKIDLDARDKKFQAMLDRLGITDF